MEKVILALVGILGAIGLLVFISFLLSWPVMWLWNNALIGAVNGVNEIGWVQAWGIMFLSSILFKSTNSKSSS